MERISEITKRDILELFQEGLNIDDFWDSKKVHYRYYGRLEELDFLKRLYDLKSMKSLDPRFSDAEGDIIQHTINNDDYPFCWVFEDERFQLRNGSDEAYLRFICEIFHPVVRYENGYWKEALEKVNELLKKDGYELYPSNQISGRDVYSWKVFNPEENKLFLPYSQRNQKLIKAKQRPLSINMNARRQIYQLLNKHDYLIHKTDETGWNYEVEVSKQVFDDIRQFYQPKCYKEKKYVETEDLEDFILGNSPYYVLDAIEFFGQYNLNTDYEAQVNTILRLNDIALKLSNGIIENIFTSQIQNSISTSIQEVGVKELLQEATAYYDEGKIKNAVEKLWDAFERLKTYYSSELDKKKSVVKIIQQISNDRKPYIELFDKEFRELTSIGNNFRIRHHETTTIDIDDERHYDYFYKRCLSLISIVLQYLDK